MIFHTTVLFSINWNMTICHKFNWIKGDRYSKGTAKTRPCDRWVLLTNTYQIRRPSNFDQTLTSLDSPKTTRSQTCLYFHQGCLLASSGNRDARWRKIYSNQRPVDWRRRMECMPTQYDDQRPPSLTLGSGLLLRCQISAPQIIIKPNDTRDKHGSSNMQKKKKKKRESIKHLHKVKRPDYLVT